MKKKEYLKNKWQEIKPTFDKLGLKPYQLFKIHSRWGDDICYINDCLTCIVHDYEFSDWIAPAYENFHIDNLIKIKDSFIILVEDDSYYFSAKRQYYYDYDLWKKYLDSEVEK